MALIEHNEPHTCDLKIRPENRAPQCFAYSLYARVHNIFLKQLKSDFSNALSEYSSAVFGMKITETGEERLPHVLKKAWRKSLFILLRFTALPCFFDTMTAILSSAEGTYTGERQFENTLFPFLNL